MNEPRPVFELTPIERKDPLWLKLRAYMEQGINDARAENDGPHDAEKTARIRGRIETFKGLIALDRDPINFGL